MINVLLTKVLFLLTLIPVFGQVKNCPLAKDSVWSHLHKLNTAKLERYEQKTIFTFEGVKSDTIVILVDGKRIAKEYMKTAGDIGRVEKTIIVARPKVGLIIIKTVNYGCAQFRLKKGYKYAYLNQTLSNEWHITYSNYARIYF